MRGLKHLVVDTETTGISWSRNGVIEIGCVLGQDSKVLSTFQALWKPLSWMQIDPWVVKNGKAYHKSMELHGSEEEIFSTQMIRLSIWLTENVTSDTVFCAYNSRFDIGMLQALELKEEVRLSRYTNWKWLDVLVWQRHLNQSGNQLSQACERKGIKIGDAHRAVDDATATFFLLSELVHDTFPNAPTRLSDLTLAETFQWQDLLAAKHEYERLSSQ